MTIEEAINVLFQVKDALINSNSWLESTKEPITDAFNLAIEALKGRLSAQRWIPVSERLPEKDGDYLVCYDEKYREDYGFDEIDIAPFEVDCEGFGIWQEHFDNYTLGSLGSEWVEIKVIAWMPLPEPYEGEL